MKGNPLEAFTELTSILNINSVYTNKDYEPYAIQRDKEITSLLASKNIDFKSYKDHVIFEENEIVKDDGTPYKVYTPFSKKWIKALEKQPEVFYPSEILLENFIRKPDNSFLSLQDIGFTKTTIDIPDFNINHQLIDN